MELIIVEKDNGDELFEVNYNGKRIVKLISNIDSFMRFEILIGMVDLINPGLPNKIDNSLDLLKQAKRMTWQERFKS